MSDFSFYRTAEDLEMGEGGDATSLTPVAEIENPGEKEAPTVDCFERRRQSQYRQSTPRVRELCPQRLYAIHQHHQRQIEGAGGGRVKETLV